MLAPIIAEENGRLILGSSQDCTAISEYAKEKHNAGEHGSSEMKYAACFPNVIIEKYCNDNGVSYAEWAGNPVHIKRMLNDPANGSFRIWKGAV